MALACNEAWEKRGKDFPMKDTGHVTEKMPLIFFDFL